MGLAVLFNLDGKDIAAFVIAGLLGLFSASLVPAGTWAVLTSILVSYHLFLAWLVIMSENRARVSLHIFSTIVTHLACLVLIVPLGLARHFIPFFGILRYGIAGMAIFERHWLFTRTTSSTDLTSPQLRSRTLRKTIRSGSTISRSRVPPPANPAALSERNTAAGSSHALRTDRRFLQTTATQAGDNAIRPATVLMAVS